MKFGMSIVNRGPDAGRQTYEVAAAKAEETGQNFRNSLPRDRGRKDPPSLRKERRWVRWGRTKTRSQI